MEKLLLLISHQQVLGMKLPLPLMQLQMEAITDGFLPQTLSLMLLLVGLLIARLTLN